MARSVESGLKKWAAEAANADMRFFAEEADARGISLRRLAILIGRDHAAVSRHMLSSKTDQDTIRLYEQALGLDDLKSRARRGAQALTQRDLTSLQRRLLRDVAMSDEYVDFTEATDRIKLALESCKPSTRLSILHAFALTGDHSAAIDSLSRLAGMPTIVRVKRKATDGYFHDIADALKLLGFSEGAIAVFLDAIRDHLGRDSAVVRANDAYLSGSMWGALAIGPDDARAAARAFLHDGESES